MAKTKKGETIQWPKQKKDRQFNCQKKKDRQFKNQKKKDR